MNAVQNKLALLESENSISRRRVRELEFELEACKKEVAHERTKILGHEEIIRQRHPDASRERERIVQANRNEKGKGKAVLREGAGSHNGHENRYHEVVEEKKGMHHCPFLVVPG